MSRVLIFREELGRPSEPYVWQQARALRTHDARLAGVVARGLSGAVVYPLPRLGGATLRAYRRRPFHPRSWRARLDTLAPDLVHVHFGVDAWRALPLLRDLGVPWLVTFHGYDVTVTRDHARYGVPGYARYVRERREVYAHAARVLAVSDHVAGCLLRDGCPPHKIERHYLGVTLPDAEAAPPPAPRDTHEVLFVGRLEAVKGPDQFLRACALVLWARPGTRLALIGEGRERRALAALAESLGLNVEFLGARPHAEVLARIHAARVVCVPSVTTPFGASEALGLVAVEAAARGVPVVAYASGGLPEAVGAGGLLVPEGDVQALADAVVTLLTDPDRHDALGRAALAHARHTFDAARQVRRLEEIYTEVLDHV